MTPDTAIRRIETLDTLSGSIERITFYNPENGYSVLRLRPESSRKIHGLNRDGLATVVGNLPELSPGEHLRLSGRWTNHPRHGLQFQVEICEGTLPATLAGIRRYLGSGLVKGIGPRLAERIVSHFGKRTLEIIENHPQRLLEVTDIGPMRAGRIARAWEEQQQVKEIMLFLHSHGVTTNLAIKIYKQYGESALQVVQSDPYRLAQDIYGIGFKTADSIAQALGLPGDHPSRIEAGLVYALNQMTDDGHVYSPRSLLAERAVDLLQVPAELVAPALQRLVQEDRVREETVPYDFIADEIIGEIAEETASYGQQAIYLTPLYFSEVGLAERLKVLSSALPSRLSDLPPAFVTLDAQLSPQQVSAIHTTLSVPLSVLTGGPGTGKTTALRALIAVLQSAGKRYALASPTGRAARRLSEATGSPASTIHRLLGFAPGQGFKHNLETPLPVDIVVIDEALMLDLSLAYSLLKAIQPGTHLLLVGDVDQLPSVGAGDVLRDVIASGIAPLTRLSVIFRQAAGSQIITNAHRINQGQMPLFPKVARSSSDPGARSSSEPEDGGDFFLFPAETPEDAAGWVLDVVSQRIPGRFGLHPRDQIQVLAPMYRGPVGVDALNAALQGALNPAMAARPERRLFGQLFRQGDKVMQVQNNYDKDVFNGDIGRLVGLDSIDQSLTVDFEGRRVDYDWGEADQLVLAYAVSVHKAQGSEFPAVVLPLVTSHYLMLQRNLLYTAVTRARRLCVLVGSRKAIGIAVRNNKVAERYTALDWRLGG